MADICWKLKALAAAAQDLTHTLKHPRLKVYKLHDAVIPLTFLLRLLTSLL